MKSLAQQSLIELGGRRSVFARQKRDHVRLDELLDRLQTAPAGREKPLLLKIYRLVFPHAFAEESVLWPVMRRVLPDGQALTLKVEREHQVINQLTQRLESLSAGEAEWRTVLGRITELLRQDVRDEEDLLLPRLQKELSPAEIRRLGTLWEIVRRIAPTRPHPVVSRRPPGNVLAALPLSILDRSRDGVDALIHRSPHIAAQPLAAVSGVLGRASHAVERLPGLRSGEDPSTRAKAAPYPGWGLAVLSIVAAGAMVALVHRRPRAPGREGYLASGHS